MSEVISFTSNSRAHPGIFYGGVKGGGGGVVFLLRRPRVSQCVKASRLFSGRDCFASRANRS